jgi:hypothetical protein
VCLKFPDKFAVSFQPMKMAQLKFSNTHSTIAVNFLPFFAKYVCAFSVFKKVTRKFNEKAVDQ